MLRKGFFAAVTLLFFAAAVIALLVCADTPLGLSAGVVQSGSMEPAIPTGSLSVIWEADAGDVKVGDIIVYNGAGGMRVEHRVVAIDKEKQTLTTKGDANAVADAGVVAFAQVCGIHVFSVPYAGYVCVWLRTHCTAVLCACALSAAVFAVAAAVRKNGCIRSKKHL